MKTNSRRVTGIVLAVSVTSLLAACAEYKSPSQRKVDEAQADLFPIVISEQVPAMADAPSDVLSDLGDAICGQFADGKDWRSIAYDMDEEAAGALSPGEIKEIIRISTDRICPEYADLASE